MEKKQTAVTLLFREFRALSEATRKAGDEHSANLIDFLCEREDVAKQMEKEEIVEAVYDSMGTNFDPNIGRAELYYKEKYENGGYK